MTGHAHPVGRFVWECRRAGRILWRDEFPNAATVEGVTAFLNQAFVGSAAGPWYMGLIDQSGYVGLSTADTQASHPGWAEWTFYTGNRPAWTPQGAAGGIMGTLLPSQWVMGSAGQLRGAFLSSFAGKGLGAGVLYAEAVRSTPRAVSVGDTISVTYAISIREP